MNAEREYPHKELSYQVIGCAFDAFKEVGVGFNEIRYHKVFHRNLLDKGLEAKYKVPAHIDYLGERIADLEIDEIVESKLIVELKDLQNGFLAEDLAQIMTYLKIRELRLGLLINFGLHRAYPKRIIFDERRQEGIERWDDIFFEDSAARRLVDPLVASIRQIDQELGVAYHSQIYQAAMQVELRRNHILCDDKVYIDTKIRDIEFTPFKIDYWMVEKLLLLGILAGNDKPRVYDIFRMYSYLNNLNLHHGLIAYWSTNNLQLYGIYQP